MSTPTTTASTDLGYSLESDLPVIPALANIDHIRVIDKQGASYRATPAQMREMVGIDKSILTEQIVPGEFWRGADGTRKQVYIRTFAGTTPTVFENTGTGHLYCWVWTLDANCNLDQIHVDHGWVDTPSDGNIDSNSGEVGYRLFPWGTRFGITANTHCKEKYLNKPYILTFKYTKK